MVESHTWFIVPTIEPWPDNDAEAKEVIFKNGAFATDFLSFDEMANEHSDPLDEWEVIGNLYENPELLD